MLSTTYMSAFTGELLVPAICFKRSSSKDKHDTSHLTFSSRILCRKNARIVGLGNQIDFKAKHAGTLSH